MTFIKKQNFHTKYSVHNNNKIKTWCSLALIIRGTARDYGAQDKLHNFVHLHPNEIHCF